MCSEDGLFGDHGEDDLPFGNSSQRRGSNDSRAVRCPRLLLVRVRRKGSTHHQSPRSESDCSAHQHHGSCSRHLHPHLHPCRHQQHCSLSSWSTCTICRFIRMFSATLSDFDSSFSFAFSALPCTPRSQPPQPCDIIPPSKTPDQPPPSWFLLPGWERDDVPSENVFEKLSTPAYD
jgi:hypothetical protein